MSWKVAAYRLKPVQVSVCVRWPRPASHYTPRGTLRATAPDDPSAVDVDKLARAILDALTGVVYRDDRQVVRLSILREWCADGIASHADIEISDAPERARA